jgi:putative lipoprotein
VTAAVALAAALVVVQDSSPAVRAQGPSVPGRAADRWFGADKLKHFVLAGFSESVAFAAARAAGADGRPALAVAVGASTAISALKEVADRRRGGRVSVRDLAWDAAGIAAHAAVLARTAR